MRLLCTSSRTACRSDRIGIRNLGLGLVHTMAMMPLLACCLPMRITSLRPSSRCRATARRRVAPRCLSDGSSEAAAYQPTQIGRCTNSKAALGSFGHRAAAARLPFRTLPASHICPGCKHSGGGKSATEHNYFSEVTLPLLTPWPLIACPSRGQSLVAKGRCQSNLCIFH